MSACSGALKSNLPAADDVWARSVWCWVGSLDPTSKKPTGRRTRMPEDRLLTAAHGLPEGLFSLRPKLEALFDALEAGGQSPFAAETTGEILDKVWKQAGAEGLKALDERERVREIVQGRVKLPVSSA